jgi:iron complex transport system permease protein
MTAAGARAAYRLPAARLAGTTTALLLLLFLSFSAALAVGTTTAVSPGQTGRSLLLALTGRGPQPGVDPLYDIVIGIRLPRVCIGALVGLCLAGSGTALQGLLLNPLADPYVIGISAGAAVGAVAVVMFGGGSALGGAGVPAGAFLAALLTLALIYSLGRKEGRLRIESFLLAGVAVGAFAWAAMTTLLAVHGAQAPEILFWLLGSLSLREQYVLPLAVVTAVSWPILIAHGQALNLLTLGEESAAQLGLHVDRARFWIIVAAALATAGAVSVSGVIAFVGLIIPHILRRIVGPDHRVLLVAAPLAGASFLVIADAAARAVPVVSPIQNLPVGVVTALLGGPFFVYLLRKRGA